MLPPCFLRFRRPSLGAEWRRDIKRKVEYRGGQDGGHGEKKGQKTLRTARTGDIRIHAQKTLRKILQVHPYSMLLQSTMAQKRYTAVADNCTSVLRSSKRVTHKTATRLEPHRVR